MEVPFDKNKVSQNKLELIAVSRDASFYSLTPKLIVRPEEEFDIIALFNFAKVNNLSVTFRAAATSLSGQALSASVVADISRAWKNVTVEDNGRKIKSQPGVVGSVLNKKLSSYGRIIGPDPASLNACMLGGILANNSSGMRSGIERNAYYSLSSLRFILSDGTIVDTSKNNADENLKLTSPKIYQGIINIKKEILADESLVNKIKSQYRIKNVVGYSLNAFLDFEKPVDILARLMIGSEGTLGFISEATLNTYPDYNHKLTGMLVFPDVEFAAAAIVSVRETGVSALEIVDNKSLQSVAETPAIKSLVGDIDNSISILLFEFQEADKDIIERKLALLKERVKSLNIIREPLITWDSMKQAELWSIRSGLLPSLGATRSPGSTFILEDICVPLEVIHKAIPALINLFKKFNYDETGIYGHGMDGNLHFMLTQNFDSEKEINRYRNFMDALADLIIDRFDGSMKAEHGTGRNIAPFVERQWGSVAFNLMKRIKKLLDPDNILNSGVLINDDSQCHIKNIKDYPVLKTEADRCIECGFCEPVCPSADLTVSPRKRIVLMREFADYDYQMINNNSSDFNYAVNDTCVVDGLCAVACPVGINTGEIIKNNRNLQTTVLTRRLAEFLSDHFGILDFLSRAAVISGHIAESVFGTQRLNNMINAVKRLFGNKKIYHWNQHIGYPSKIITADSDSFEFLYFPTCISRITGKPSDTSANSLVSTIQRIAKKANINLKIPANVNNYCCGTVFNSKGFYDAYVNSINKLMEMLWRESDEGKLPVVFDASSCLHTVRNCRPDLNANTRVKYDLMTILDLSEFISDYILPRINIKSKLNRVILHQNCSVRKLNIENRMESIAANCADEVIIPESQSCCGMGGDRGLIFPELTQSATKYESAEVRNVHADGFYSSNLPCEAAMSQETNKNYLSIAYLVDKVSD